MSYIIYKCSHHIRINICTCKKRAQNVFPYSYWRSWKQLMQLLTFWLRSVSTFAIKLFLQVLDIDFEWKKEFGKFWSIDLWNAISQRWNIKFKNWFETAILLTIYIYLSLLLPLVLEFRKELGRFWSIDLWNATPCFRRAVGW